MRFIDSRHNPWITVTGEDGPLPQPDRLRQRLLTLEQWRAVREHWPDGQSAGVLVPNIFDVDGLADDLRTKPPRLALVVLEFPKWTDGRAYSQARLLRQRYAFGGEIRATGEVLADMLPLLQRCGFNAVQLRHDQRVETAMRALGFFDEHYQGDVRQPLPAFARDTLREPVAAGGRVAAELLAGHRIGT